MRQLITQSSQLSQILKGRRQALGLTQSKLAPKLAISQNRLSQLETNPNGLRLDKLLDLLNLLSLDLVIEDRTARKRDEW